MNESLSMVLRNCGGVVSARDLAAAGIGRGQLRWALERGQVVRLAPRLYADPGIDLSRDADRRLAALVHGGPDAVLSHSTAAAIWEMRSAAVGEPVHVTVRRGVASGGLRGVVVHQSALVEATTRSGWPVTSPRGTLTGLAANPDENVLRFPALAALQRGLVCAADLSDSTDVPRVGLGRWNRVADEAAVGAESGGEGVFWRLMSESTLPVPELNRWVVAAGRRYRIDALWPGLRIGAEIDGRDYHTRVGDFDRDHVRQNQIHGQGIMLIRFTVRQVLDDPAEVVRQTAVNLSARAQELGLSQLM